MHEDQYADDRCDLDFGKICDNCCKCIDTDSDYIEIPLRFEGENSPQDALPRSKPRKRRDR